MTVVKKFVCCIFVALLIFSSCLAVERAEAKAGPSVEKVHTGFNVITKDSKSFSISMLYNENRYLDGWKSYAQNNGGDNAASEKLNKIIVQRAKMEARRMKSEDIDKFQQAMELIFQDINSSLGFDAVQYPRLVVK